MKCLNRKSLSYLQDTDKEGRLTNSSFSFFLFQIPPISIVNWHFLGTYIDESETIKNRLLLTFLLTISIKLPVLDSVI